MEAGRCEENDRRPFRQHNPRGKNRQERGFRDLSDQVALPEGTIPPLVDPTAFAAVKQRLERNKQFAARHNPDPTAALLRAGFARCGSCGRTMVVNRNRNWNQARYACTHNEPGDRCPEFPTVAVHILDNAVWASVREFLSDPDLVAGEVERRKKKSHVEVDLAPVERAIADVERRQRTLVSNLALLDLDSAALVREQLSGLMAQRRVLETRRAELVNHQAEQAAARERLLELSEACQLVSANLQRFSYEQRRLALEAFDIQVKVWKSDHGPRWTIEPGPGFREWIVSRTARGIDGSSRKSVGRRGRFR